MIIFQIWMEIKTKFMTRVKTLW